MATHQKFSDKYGIRYPLVDDASGEIRRLYGGGRVTYIVERDGAVRFVQKGIPNNDELLAELEKF